ncbi:ankyrin repeat, SAM and basic leucine zipper domain-containing protein 1 [Megalops cyprinoides]|uniref:ankyrin repeat, SAM and basic leucine zipper domain-containing protein 1 n=1 Tax=Megalops cyprinoides TaxID=118141 RepID=UPI0018640CE5|nr:ankyrin repeat, SAM and basic leucine zipper domain-containing protein 1 [Megalops cyprinoides]
MCAMQQELLSGVPAGDESDGSEDDWDIRYSQNPERSSLMKCDEMFQTDICVPAPEEDRTSALKRAISNGDVQSVERLLDDGVDVESRLGFEWTPLLCAAHVANHDLAKLLLDRGANANFSRDHFTVLMAACTATASEDRIARCVELLLSRNANPNTHNNTHMTPLMLAARDGYSQVITLLVSHGAQLNSQDSNGYTALALAVLYGREEAVMKLLQLGADKTIKTKSGKSVTELASMHKHTQISRILAAPRDPRMTEDTPSKEETLCKFFKWEPDPPAATTDSSAKLSDIELLLHGLGLDHLSDIMLDNDISWSCLLAMEREDLEKIGVSSPEDQCRILSAVQQMQLDTVDLHTFTQLDNIGSSGDELYSFLISLRQQCCYLTEVVQDVIGRFPQSASELVLSWDPRQESQAICNDLVLQTSNLQREITCLKNLLAQMNASGDPRVLPLPGSHGGWKRAALKTLALSMLGAGLLLLLSRANSPALFIDAVCLSCFRFAP